MSEPQHPRHRLFYPMTRGAAQAFVTLSVILLLTVAANLVFTSQEVNGATATRASVVQLCETGNEFRAEQMALWLHIVAISVPPPHETAAQERQRKATLRAFVAYIHKVFAPRDCTARFGR